MSWIRRTIQHRHIPGLVYALAAIVASMQKLVQGRGADGYTAYENYLIFKNSFAHLLQGANPYAAFPAEQWDLFKYSPAFALLMAPFSALPDWAGLPLWNLLNALPLLGAILTLPGLSGQQRRFFAWFVLPELVISLQNSQSNGLTAACLLWAFIAFEKGRSNPAAWWTVAGAFIKIFGVFAAVPALLYPHRYRFGRWLALWTLVLVFVPLIAVSPQQLLQVYRWWWELLRDDHAVSTGLSVSGWLQTWFGWAPPKMAVTLAGFVLLLASALAALRPAPALNRRMLVWASVLIWVVIFNHKAESPTFIIALCGVVLWYFSMAPPRQWAKILLGVSFVLVSLSPTDLFPRTLRAQLLQPYVLKAVPCIAIWLLICWKLFFPKANSSATSEHE